MTYRNGFRGTILATIMLFLSIPSVCFAQIVLDPVEVRPVFKIEEPAQWWQTFGVDQLPPHIPPPPADSLTVFADFSRVPDMARAASIEIYIINRTSVTQQLEEFFPEAETTPGVWERTRVYYTSDVSFAGYPPSIGPGLFRRVNSKIVLGKSKGPMRFVARNKNNSRTSYVTNVGSGSYNMGQMEQARYDAMALPTADSAFLANFLAGRSAEKLGWDSYRLESQLRLAAKLFGKRFPGKSSLALFDSILTGTIPDTSADYNFHRIGIEGLAATNSPQAVPILRKVLDSPDRSYQWNFVIEVSFRAIGEISLDSAAEIASKYICDPSIRRSGVMWGCLAWQAEKHRTLLTHPKVAPIIRQYQYDVNHPSFNSIMSCVIADSTDSLRAYLIRIATWNNINEHTFDYAVRAYEARWPNKVFQCHLDSTSEPPTEAHILTLVLSIRNISPNTIGLNTDSIFHNLRFEYNIWYDTPDSEWTGGEHVDSSGISDLLQFPKQIVRIGPGESFRLPFRIDVSRAFKVCPGRKLLAGCYYATLFLPSLYEIPSMMKFDQQYLIPLN